MNFDKSSDLEKLLSLADDKIRYLQDLKKDMLHYYENLSELSDEQIASEMEDQDRLTSLISDIDGQYRQIKEALIKNKNVFIPNMSTKSLPEECSSQGRALYEKLQLQKQLFSELSELNSKTIEKAETLLAEYKENIKNLNKQKILLDTYTKKGITPTFKADRYKGGRA